MAFLYNGLVLGLAASTVTALPQRAGRPGGHPGPGGNFPIRGPQAPSGPWRGIGRSKSPAYNYMYQYPLPIPEVIQPEFSNNVNGRTVDFYSLEIKSFDAQIYPDLGPAHLTGYNGMSPGPSFVVERGHETIVRALNQGSLSASVHLHGSATQAVWDGWAEDNLEVGQWKDYYYPNYESARSMWYHDHAHGHTSTNAYFGQAGAYIIHDANEDALGLPSGQYDVPLAIVDKIYLSNGDLVSPEGETRDFLGDIIHVNDQPWPYLSVEPRMYRFRIYDMSLSRPYDLYFEDPLAYMLNFQVIASDSGLFASPVTTSDLLISMGERYEVVIDFSPYAGKNITLKNKLQIPVVDEFQHTDEVMMFVVGNSVSDSSNNAVPATLSSGIPWPAPKDTVDHTFSFQQGGEDAWTINGIDFEDVNNRILAKPAQGAVELWELKHTGGQTVHPVHIHLVNLQVVSRTGGSRGVLPYESAGLKDTVLLEPGETVRALAYYGPWDGVYMFHCHNLIHEDHAMMAVMNITLLEALGYDSTTGYADPTDARFAPKDYNDEAFTPEAEQSAVLALAKLNPYDDPYAVISAQQAYYATAGNPSEATATVAPGSPTATRTAGGRPTGRPTGRPGRPTGRP